MQRNPEHSTARLSSSRPVTRYPLMSSLRSRSTPARRLLATVGLVVSTALASVQAAPRPAKPADPTATAARVDNADDAFLAARDAFRAGDVARATILAQRVSALDSRYPLAGYLDYWALSRQIREYGDALTVDAPDDAIRAFIARNPGSVVADLARRDWLLALGKRGEWSTFEAEMPKFALNDDAQVTCFQLTARALRQIRGATGRPDAAETDSDAETSVNQLLRLSRAAIAQPRDYASDVGACATLARVLVAEKRVTQQDVWGWMRLASDANNAVAVRRYALLLSDAERGNDNPRFYRQLDAVLDKPALWLAKTNEGGEGGGVRYKRELAVLAFARIVRADPTDGRVEPATSAGGHADDGRGGLPERATRGRDREEAAPRVERVVAEVARRRRPVRGHPRLAGARVRCVPRTGSSSRR